MKNTNDLALPTRPISLELSDSIAFDDLDAMMRRAIAAETITTQLVQSCFSAVLIRNRWKEARAWSDTQTGELYLREEDAPPNANLVLTDIPRYRTHDDWVTSLVGIRGFAKSTCYERHKEIMRQVNLLGRTFEDAVNSVVLAPSHSKMLLNHTIDNQTGQFIPSEVVKLLPEPMREETMQRIDEGGAEVCQEIVMKQIEADDAKVAAGIPVRNINADLSKALGTYAAFSIRLSEKRTGFVITRDKDDIITQYHVTIEPEGLVGRVPQDVILWLAKRLHIEV